MVADQQWSLRFRNVLRDSFFLSPLPIFPSACFSAPLFVFPVTFFKTGFMVSREIFQDLQIFASPSANIVLGRLKVRIFSRRICEQLSSPPSCWYPTSSHATLSPRICFWNRGLTGGKHLYTPRSSVDNVRRLKQHDVLLQYVSRPAADQWSECVYKAACQNCR